jgi:hypothetical protein
MSLRVLSRGFWIGVAAVLCVLATAERPAHAWKPFTHVFAGTEAYQDAVADGQVTINGRTYNLDARLLTALRQQRSHYNAGVIGPDGFPDLTYGQSVIHPSATGEWLRHVLRSGRGVQAQPVPETFKQQSLAFSYGFLTHAAGDLWAHTFVNDFAQGVFPSVSELVQIDKAEIAIRHFVVEGYVGDATIGYDGNPEAGPAPGPGCSAGNPLCDRSDDSTPGISFAVPTSFVYDTLIDQNADTPSPERGPLIGFFLGLRGQLDAFKQSTLGADLAAAAASFNDTKEQVEDFKEACNFDDLDDLVECPIEATKLGITAVIDSVEAAVTAAGAVLKEAARKVFGVYINAWIADIDRGLRAWPELGLATTKGLFDAQTRRDLQNDECRLHVEGTLSRDECEADIGMVDTVFSASNTFVNQHLLSMLGLPDIVGQIREVLDEVTALLDDILAALSVPFNPLRVAKDQIERFAKDLIRERIEDALGVDLEAFKSFLDKPGAWFLVDDTGPLLGSLLGFPGQSLRLFRPNDHDRADGFMALPGNHHIPIGIPFPGFPPNAATRLTDDAEFNIAAFRALENTITTSKLLLLGGPELNRALGDILVADGFLASAAGVRTYPSAGDDGVNANVLVNQLGSGPAWLKSIDSDHGWRHDGLPRFCDTGGNCDPIGSTLPQPRSPDLNGGNGNFPLWESCLLRPAFRRLFKDWEGDNFPDHGDLPGPDPSDAGPPSILQAVTNGFVRVVAGVPTQFVSSRSQIALSASDDLFVQAHVGLKTRLFPDGAPVPAFADAPNPGTLTPGTGADGRWRLDVEAEEPCHTSNPADTLEPARRSTPLIVDNTPPVITINAPPPNTAMRTNEQLTLAFSADDGPLGAGVASLTATFDGAPVVPGQVLDLFLFTPGIHTLVVSTTDNLGNSGSVTRTLRLFVDAAALRDNLDRYFVEAKITSVALYDSMRLEATAAIEALNRGRTADAAAALERLMKKLWSKWDGQCRVTASCRDIDRATLAQLVVRTADAIAVLQVPALALGQSNVVADLFETLNLGFLAGKATRGYNDLRAALSPAVLRTYSREFGPSRSQVNSFLSRLTTQLGEPCRASLETCFVERPFGLQLTRTGGEIAATVGLSPAVLAGLKVLPLLRSTGDVLVAGGIPTVDTYHSLRDRLSRAIAAESGWATTSDPVKEFRDALGSLRGFLFDLYEDKCVEGSKCNRITVALADELLVKGTEVKALHGIDPALLPSLRTRPLLTDLLEGYRRGDIPDASLFDDLSTRAIDFVAAEGNWPRPNQTGTQRDRLDAMLETLIGVIKAGCASGARCDRIDRLLADHLLVKGSEALALVGVPAGAVPGLKALAVLRLLNQRYLDGDVPDIGSYEKLRDLAVAAVVAEAKGDKSKARQALKDFVKEDTKLVDKGCSSSGCRYLDRDAGNALAAAANRSLQELG